MKNKKPKTPPRPELYQWYKEENKVKRTVHWNIWVVKRETILWGFFIYENGRCDLDHINLRYWDEADYPWEKVLDANDVIEKTEMPSFLKEGTLREIVLSCLGEHQENSNWFFR